MGLFGALYTGVSGLNAQAQAQSTISENVSNVNTVGYKRVQTDFSTLVVESSPRAYSPGGVLTSTSYGITDEGTLQGTTSETDIGISGPGFIIVNQVANPSIQDEFLYTRAGKFTTDENKNLKNTAGYYLQGWKLDNLGNLPTANSSLVSLQTVNLDKIPGISVTTKNVTAYLQLPASSPIDSVADPSLGPFVTGSQQSQDVPVYDSLGVPQTVRLVFTHVGTNAWNLTINPGSYGNPPVANKVTNVLDNVGAPLSPPNQLGTPLVSGDQHLRVTFNSDGTLQDITNADTGTSVYNSDGTIKVRFDFSASGASPIQDVSFNFGQKNPVTRNSLVTAAATIFTSTTGTEISGIKGTVLGSVRNDPPATPGGKQIVVQSIGTTFQIDIPIGGEVFRGVVSQTAAASAVINFRGVSSPVNGFNMTLAAPLGAGGPPLTPTYSPAEMTTFMNTYFNTASTPTSFTVSGLPTQTPPGTSQKNSDFIGSTVTQDGVAYGVYKGININKEGVVIANFTNGESLPIYQLPLATFPNPNGLAPRTGNAYSKTRDSGELVLNQAGVAGIGQVFSRTLENSTVDIGTEFAKMIITQRAYNANTRVVSTSRDMLAELDRLVQ
ncbi:MAG: flagellar hook protein FlgE [Holosporales bacterium]|jgi:flagellar hook protein FlgE